MNEENKHIYNPTPIVGAQRRRGPFRYGERVQITDHKKQHYTITIKQGGFFQSRRGGFRHEQLVGRDEGTILETESGHKIICLRPILPDFVLSMPRGATVIYPKDSGQIIYMADIYPGARVLEAGAGSGALSIALLAAVGETGRVHSVELRPEFADIARGNVESWYAGSVSTWQIEVADLAQVLSQVTPASYDRVVLDMLAPWEHIAGVSQALEPGGVFLAYVATTTQMSRLVETIKQSQKFTPAVCSETLIRGWHVNGLAVRPDHRMVAHTGFLVQARRLAANSVKFEISERPAPAAYSQPLEWENADGSEQIWGETELQARSMSDKKIRKVRRDIASRYIAEGLAVPESFRDLDLP